MLNFLVSVLIHMKTGRPGTDKKMPITVFFQ